MALVGPSVSNGKSLGYKNVLDPCLIPTSPSTRAQIRPHQTISLVVQPKITFGCFKFIFAACLTIEKKILGNG